MSQTLAESMAIAVLKGDCATRSEGRGMKLTELEPRFMKRDPGVTEGSSTFVDSITEADGVIFLCPVCFVVNKGNVGTHSIICWRPHVPPEINPKPGRWEFSGTGYDDLTLTGNPSSSVLLTTATCKAHFHVRNGEIV